MGSDSDLKRLQTYWRDEVEAASVYDALARQADNEQTRKLLEEMRDTESRHAKRWEGRIQAVGGSLPQAPSMQKARRLSWLAKLIGQDRVFRQLESVENQAVAGYGAGMADAVSSQMASEMQADERQHATALDVMGRNPLQGAEAILSREKWHGRGGGAMREVIFGANDGLVSTLSLVSGVAGAAVGRSVVLLAGVAGLLSGAISMAAGAYISTKSQREVFEAQVGHERTELESEPEEEKEELRTLFRLKGYTEPEARKLVDRIAQDPELMLQSLVRDELGLMPERFPNPWLAGIQSGAAFIIGSFIPLIGYLFFGGTTAVLVSVGISVAALFIVGVLKTFFTGRPWLRSGLEMVSIGVFATLVTYLIGSLFHV